jgi:hypothetical protein
MYGGSNLEGYIIVWGITIIQMADSGASALVEKLRNLCTVVTSALKEKLRSLCNGKNTPDFLPWYGAYALTEILRSLHW